MSTEPCTRSREVDEVEFVLPVKVGATLFWSVVSAQSVRSLFPLTRFFGLEDGLLVLAHALKSASHLFFGGAGLGSTTGIPLASKRGLLFLGKLLGWGTVLLLSYCPIGRLAFATPLKMLLVKLQKKLVVHGTPDSVSRSSSTATIASEAISSFRVIVSMAKMPQGALCLANAVLFPMLRSLLSSAATQQQVGYPLGTIFKLLGSIVSVLQASLTVVSLTCTYTQLFPRHLIPSNPWKSLQADTHYKLAPVSHRKVGVLICNLGTPTSPAPNDVAAFLKPFLSDRRVVEITPLVWRFLLNYIIIPRRKYTSGKLYRRLFHTTNSVTSPLTYHTRQFVETIEGVLGDDYVVLEGMRYGEPSIENQLDVLKEKRCEQIIVFPKYPQYSGTTSASIYDDVFESLRKYRFVPSIHVVAPYYDADEYVDSLVHVTTKFLQANHVTAFTTSEEVIHDNGSEEGVVLVDKFIISFHGIPERYHTRGDPYPYHCEATAKAFANKMNWTQDMWIMTYQSIFGRDPWLKPATDETLQSLAENGAKRVVVVCPGFLTDCLETVDENGTENAKIFHEHGGEELLLVPCLNSDEFWCKQAAMLIKRDARGWMHNN
eukprot:m.138670 g.138670  ORF g.138670 m.138670 type:complete len:602 (-) comp15997_c0_seq1:90-1895(-)